MFSFPEQVNLLQIYLVLIAAFVSATLNRGVLAIDDLDS